MRFEEALKVYTIVNYPINYATVQNNLGSAYANLSRVRENENNLQKAIEIGSKKLSRFTLSRAIQVIMQ